VDALREEVSNLKQENRRIRRRLQGAAAPKPPMEVFKLCQFLHHVRYWS